MKYRPLGRSGVQVSELGLGSWLTFGLQIAEETARACVREAFSQGINFFDTADIYANGRAEETLGRCLKEHRRSEFVVATKVFYPMGSGPNDRGLSRKHIVESCEASLARLQLERIDLYQCHGNDPKTPIEETVRAMDDLVRQGKILYWGVSQWDAHRIMLGCDIARRRNADLPVTNQTRYHVFDRAIEQEIMPACAAHGMGQIVYSPLEQGLLTGKYKRSGSPEGCRGRAHQEIGQFLQPWLNDPVLERVERLGRVAADAGVTLAQLALAFCLRPTGVASVLLGASRPEQVRENVRACEVRIDDALQRAIDSAILWQPPQDRLAFVYRPSNSR